MNTTEAVVPEGRDPLDDLTVGELGTVGKLLKCDPYVAVQDSAQGIRWPALAHLAWVWTKRTDPAAKLAPFLELTPAEVSTLLRMVDDDQADDEDQGDEVDEADPTASARG